MTNPTEPHEDRRLRRKTAAFRLKHDIGKAVRWSAPEEKDGERGREKDIEELRGRLRRDLLSRTSGGAASRDVLESFLEWKREEGPLFHGNDPDLEALERAMAVVASLAPRLAAPSGTSGPSGSLAFKESLSSSSPSSSLSLSEAKSSSSLLSESELVALDDACIEASRACTAFYRRVAVGEGPETIRPIGARR